MISQASNKERKYKSGCKVLPFISSCIWYDDGWGFWGMGNHRNLSGQIINLNRLGRRRIKVIAGSTLASVEKRVKDWLQEGNHVRHLQIDYMPEQPPCERWQALITYYINIEADPPPRRKCYRCADQEICSRYQEYLHRQEEKQISISEDELVLRKACKE